MLVNSEEVGAFGLYTAKAWAAEMDAWEGRGHAHDFYGWQPRDIRPTDWPSYGMEILHWVYVEPKPSHDFYGWNPDGWLYKHESMHEAFAKARRDYVPPTYYSIPPDAWQRAIDAVIHETTRPKGSPDAWK